MPPNTATLRVGPYFLSLFVVLIALFALVFLPGQRHTPKLGLDLEGGATVTLQAQTPNNKQPAQSAMKVARQILENRVNAKGVSAAQVFQQGSDEIVISVPGANSQQIAKIGQAAKLNFRPLVMAGVANTSTTTTTTATPSGTASSGATAKSSGAGTSTTGATSTGAKAATTAPKTSATTPKSTTSPNGLLAAPTTTPAATSAGKTAAKTTAAKTTAAKTTAAAPTTTAAAPALSGDPFKSLGFALPTTDTAFNALTTTQQSALTAALGRFDCSVKPTDVATADLAACDNSNPPGYKYLLGPVLVAGTEISSADAVAPDGTNTQTWTVSINLKSKGQRDWATFTGAHHSSASTADASTCTSSTTPCADYVAFTLDGAVIGAPPQTQSTINGTTQVSGNFSESSAKDLANDLKYGALPLNFRQLQAQDISATLGSSQLTAGLLAGGIGLILVVIYSFLYYRGLGFVTVFSLVVSGTLTYACLVILGRAIGFTLTLAGIAGFIVAVGITADSFVVLFERLKDEVHSGRSIRVAVPRAWTRARRTILSADTVSFLAALILYYFTVGDVRGFAFTLGLSTLLDLVVVFLFTHPLVSLLSRSRTFGSPRFTGLNSVRAGGIAPSPEGHVRPAKSRPSRGGGRTAPAGSVALLERDDDTDFDDDDAIADTPVSAPAASTTAEPELDSGAPRRSRVVPRSAPAAEIGADAAERAAARRGRTVRPPKPEVEEPAEDDLDDDVDRDDDDVNDLNGVDELNGDDAPDGDDGLDADGATEVSDTSAPVEAPVAAPKAPPVKRAPAKAAPVESAPVRAASANGASAQAVPTGSTAAERAAARRRRPRPDTPQPAATVPAAIEPAVPTPTPDPEPPSSEPAAPAGDDVATEDVSSAARPIESEPEVAAAEPVAEAAAPETATADTPSRPTTAAERAAARRARIRTRAGGAADTDGEGES